MRRGQQIKTISSSLQVLEKKKKGNGREKDSFPTLPSPKLPALEGVVQTSKK
jgi:hypothetical protein